MQGGGAEAHLVLRLEVLRQNLHTGLADSFFCQLLQDGGSKNSLQCTNPIGGYGRDDTGRWRQVRMAGGAAAAAAAYGAPAEGWAWGQAPWRAARPLGARLNHAAGQEEPRGGVESRSRRRGRQPQPSRAPQAPCCSCSNTGLPWAEPANDRLH